MVASGPRMRDALAAMPEEVLFRTGILGAAATEVAYSEGDAWLDGIVASIAANRTLLAGLVVQLLPGAVFHEPHATYIAWLDLRAYGLGDDPAQRLLDDAAVALGSGPAFGRQGRGFVRVNYACRPELLGEAIERLAAALATAGASVTGA